MFQAKQHCLNSIETSFRKLNSVIKNLYIKSCVLIKFLLRSVGEPAFMFCLFPLGVLLVCFEFAL